MSTTSGAPLDLEGARAAKVRLGKLHKFAKDFYAYSIQKSKATATADWTAFEAACADVTDSDCAATTKCFLRGQDDDPPTMGLVAGNCTATNHVWDSARLTCEYTLGNPDADCPDTGYVKYVDETPKDRCCKDGKKTCEYTPAGKEYGSESIGLGCFGTCSDDTSAGKYVASNTSAMAIDYYNTRCGDVDKFMRVALLGAKAGTCRKCTFNNGNDFLYGSHDQHGCEGRGLCTNGGSHSIVQGSWSCPGTYTPLTWSTVPDVVSETVCKEDNSVCLICADGNEKASSDQMNGVFDKHGCPAGMQFDIPSNITTEIACEAAGGKWRRKYNMHDEDVGELVPILDIPANTNLHPEFKVPFLDRVHGPSHTEPSHLLRTSVNKGICLDQAKFLADAADLKTPEEAWVADPTYYEDVFWNMLPRVKVGNGENVAAHATMRFIDGTEGNKLCFFSLMKPINGGDVSFTTGSDTFGLILEPAHLSVAQPLVVSGSGSAVVLGGTAAGPLTFSTTGTAEVYGTENAGKITATGSNNIIIANVDNKENGEIDANGVQATFIAVENSGKVKAQDVTIKAYEITNKASGTIDISGASVIHLDLGCSEGEVTLGASVTGTLKYQDGCGLTLTNNAAADGLTVTVVAAGAATQELRGSISASVALPAGTTGDDLMASSVYVATQQVAIGNALGVAHSDVEITSISVGSSRRLDAIRRKLPAMDVTVAYKVTIPATQVEETKASMADTNFANTIKTETNSAMAAADWTADSTFNGQAPTVESVDQPEFLGTVEVDSHAAIFNVNELMIALVAVGVVLFF